MNQIMLRFRPIAPKPAGAGASSSDAADQQRKNGDVYYKNGKRTKRKYVRVRNRKSKVNKETVKATPTTSPEKSAVENDSSSSSLGKRRPATLQLLPDRSVTDNHDNIVTPDKVEQAADDGVVLETRSLLRWLPYSSVSWIIVECVTEISTDDSKLLGFSDKDKIKGLELDTCPGFVSNGVNNLIIWANDAYKRMVVGSSSLMGARLVVKEMLPRFSPWFACRVTMIFQQTKGGQKWNRIVPCDVWRMDEFPGFAWRLDVTTSIGLGF